jgi:hypothetical protein
LNFPIAAGEGCCSTIVEAPSILLGDEIPPFYGGKLHPQISIAAGEGYCSTIVEAPSILLGDEIPPFYGGKLRSQEKHCACPAQSFLSVSN